MTVVVLSLARCDSGSATPAETDTGPVASLDFAGDSVTDRSVVTIQRVAVTAAGWIVIWDVGPSGTPLSPPLAAVALGVGEQKNLVVPLSSPLTGNSLHLSVHVDAPADGQFKATSPTATSGVDPVMLAASGAPAAATVALSALPPLEENQLVIADQAVTGSPAKITATVTVAAIPKYLVIRDATGAVVGSERIWQKGTADYLVSVDIPTSYTPSVLTGALVGADGNQPDLEAPVLTAAGAPLEVTFEATRAPEVVDQLVIANQTLTMNPAKVTATVTVDAFPKYLVIRNAAGAVVGSERIWQKGPAEYQATVDIPKSWTPAVLTGSLVGADGNQPDLDAPVLTAAGAPLEVTFEATRPPANSLSVADQTLTSWGYKIAVDEVRSDELPAWVAVYADNAGAPGELLGQLAVTSSPKVKVQVNLTRFVLATETLWVAVLADLPADGQLTAADPTLLGADKAPLLTKIVVTNGSCDGVTSKYCDPAKPGVIRWLDRCGKPSDVETDCGDGVCTEAGGYVACTKPLNPCGGNTKKVCTPNDPYAVYWENACGTLTKVAFPCGGAAVCDATGAEAKCTTPPQCAGNATLVCDAANPSAVFWLDHCGALTGGSIPCGASAVCDDAEGSATCVSAPSCGGNKVLVCNPADLGNLYWRDGCDALTGATLPCGAGLTCDDTNGIAHCVNPNPCDGPSQKFCDPEDLSVIKWLDGCGAVKASTIPCGANTQCSAASGEAECVSTDTCGGNTTTVCVQDDPGQVYWLDGCGVLTGSTYPCGVATCDDSSGTATCAIIGTCADEKRRVCDATDPTTIRLVNGCEDDLGVFAVCANGKQCLETTPGQARCECVPTDEVTCFGGDFLYEPSGVRKLDSCGYPSGPVVTTCELGEVCNLEGPVGAKVPTCTTSLSDPSGVMGHRGCSFNSYLEYKTDLAVDCRCRRHPADKNDFYGYDTSGNIQCMAQADSVPMGYTVGAGPRFGHILHNFNGGGAIGTTSGELFTTMHYTTSSYQKAGLVVAYDLETGDRRIVTGRYPEPSGEYTMFGSGYESERSVGTQRFEATTLPGAWDLEIGADGLLYVWGNVSGNQEITRVHPVTGARTLVWRQALEGEATEPPFGQCYSTRPKTTFASGFIPVQLQTHAFTMAADGSFYLGFRNEAAEGNGIVKISADGATCTVVSRWNGTMGSVGGGAAPQYSSVEGYTIHAGKLYASIALGSHLLAIDLSTGNRTLIALGGGSDELTPGQSTMFWDATRDLLITAGGIQSYLGVAVDLSTGERQSLFRVGPGQLIEGPAPFDINAHGAIDNGNYMGYGALAMDPADNDVLYLTIKWGLIKYEISTGNSYVMSQ